LKERLKDLFKSKIGLARDAKGKGKITIPFANDEELEEIMDFFDSIQKN
jgi:ParB family chromosome partitioning protein